MQLRRDKGGGRVTVVRGKFEGDEGRKDASVRAKLDD
jgi:hypothetical protein